MLYSVCLPFARKRLTRPLTNRMVPSGTAKTGTVLAGARTVTVTLQYEANADVRSTGELNEIDAAAAI